VIKTNNQLGYYNNKAKQYFGLHNELAGGMAIFYIENVHDFEDISL